MDLTFNKSYADYTDLENWLPQLAFLKEVAEVADPESVAALDDTALLDTLENLEELMRFYCADKDMTGLEYTMRKFDALMRLARARGISGVETAYLEMVFLRINAILYRGNSMYRQAAGEYAKCVKAAQICYGKLPWSQLSEEQLLYVGWNCIECYREAAETSDGLLDAESAVAYLRQAIPMLKWIEQYLPLAPGICDQAAELYASIGGVLYQNHDLDTGARCYQRAVALFRELDEQIGSDFYLARSIWLQGTYGFMDYFQRGDVSAMIRCEQQVDAYLRERPRAADRDKAIVQGAKGMVQVQRGAALQQNGNLPGAIAEAAAGCQWMSEALDTLEAEYKPRQDYYRTVVYRIAARIFNSYVGALDSLGVMYYQNSQLQDAEDVFQQALTQLTDSENYTMGESGAAMIRAEVNQYLGLIRSEQGDIHQADFYATQSADQAMELVEQSGNPLVLALAVVSCSLAAELSLAMKNKPKALQYAEKGLMACDMLERANSQDPHLALRGNLIKFKKKASRRFF